MIAKKEPKKEEKKEIKKEIKKEEKKEIKKEIKKEEKKEIKKEIKKEGKKEIKKDIKKEELEIKKDIKKEEKKEIKQEIETEEKKDIKTEITKEEKSMFEPDKDSNYENYHNLDVSKLKKEFSFKIDIPFATKIFVLRDGRIIVYNTEYRFNSIIYDLKNNIAFKLNIEYIHEIIQMDDGIVIIRGGKKISVIEIYTKNVLVLQSFNLDDDIKKMHKLSNQNILFIGKYKSIYSYENKKLNLKEKKELYLKPYIYRIFNIIDIYIINENEIVVFYWVNGQKYIMFHDLKNNTIIKEFEIENNKAVFSLINDNLFIYANQTRIYPIYLKKHKKGIELTLGNCLKDIEIYSIIPLNEKQFIVAQYGCITQFELKENNEIKYIQAIELKNMGFSKYLNNKFIFLDYPGNRYSSIIHLYG